MEYQDHGYEKRVLNKWQLAFFFRRVLFFFYMIVASPIVLSFFLRPSFLRLLSSSRELFLILVLNPVGMFVEKKAQEVRFARVCIPILFLLVAVRSSVPIFFSAFFFFKKS